MSIVKKFRFYFSFRSPFAGIAFYRLRRSPLFKDCEIKLIPLWPQNIFGGHMDNPTDNLFKIAYIFSDAARQAEEAGITPTRFHEMAKNFQLPKNADYSSKKVGLSLPPEPWEITHHAFLYAQEQGLAWAFGDEIFNRRFDFDGQGSGDVLQAEVIGKIAEQLGLDAESCVNASASGRYQDTQAKQVKKGEEEGVFGVPFFSIDQPRREVFWGNDRLPFLYKSLSGDSELPLITAESLNEIQPTRR
jgi:2-hydroxychromene-2-carboxylate isomerase